jgi:hypothetical protein
MRGPCADFAQKDRLAEMRGSFNKLKAEAR